MINSQMTSHERFIADLAELATGVLDRREEPALLNHLVDCPNCMGEFEELVSAAKSLLLLVLEIEPPVGFETRFWDRVEACSSGTGVAEQSCLAQVVLHRSGCDQPWAG
jgi:hypothetical protein